MRTYTILILRSSVAIHADWSAEDDVLEKRVLTYALVLRLDTLLSTTKLRSFRLLLNTLLYADHTFNTTDRRCGIAPRKQTR